MLDWEQHGGNYNIHEQHKTFCCLFSGRLAHVEWDVSEELWAVHHPLEREILRRIGFYIEHNFVQLDPEPRSYASFDTMEYIAEGKMDSEYNNKNGQLAMDFDPFEFR